LLIQSSPSPLPSFLSTTLVSPARRTSSSRFARISISLFPFPSLFSPYFHLFTNFPLYYSRLPEHGSAPSVMPTTSGAHARAADCFWNSSTRAAHLLQRVQLARSRLAPRPTRSGWEIFLQSQGPRRSTCRDTPPLSTPRCHLMHRQGPLRKPRLGNSLR
jgi:hypothetical protein